MAEVLLENVCKVFPGGVTAVDNVNLQIADREFIVLVGPSGCGKSTTLRMVAGLEDISSGVIRIGERVVNDVAPKDRDIAMVFQNYALYPHMTVRKNLAFGLMLRRDNGFWDNPIWAVLAPPKYRAARQERHAIEKRVAEAARMLGIEGLLARKPKELSGGQRQRVAVGRAIVREPKAYLFDEPLSNLDAKLRVEMRAELKRLHRQVQTTTIYVTHDQEEAMTLGERIVVMKDGLVQQVAPPFEVYERPVNRFVAGFVGTPPMNFLDGRLVRVDGALAFEDGESRLKLSAAQQQALAGYADKLVTLGVRPDALSLGGDANGATLKAQVGVVEPLGDRMDVIVSTALHRHIVCRVDGRTRVRESENIAVHLDMSRVHFFEPAGAGRNLTLN
ncbi:MAG: ATP-binding cassette domain-containing protein [Phycisphaerae bacterium]